MPKLQFLKYSFTFPNKIAYQGYAYLIGPHATQCYKYSEVGKIARVEALKQESTSWWVNSRWVHPYFICSLWSDHYVDSAEKKLFVTPVFKSSTESDVTVLQKF